MSDTGDKRAKIFLLPDFAPRKRQGTQCPSMKGPEEGDHPLPFCFIPGKFKCSLHGLGAGICEKDPLFKFPRRELGQLVSQFHLGFVIKVRPRHVEEFFGLFLNGADHLGMTMAGGSDGNACRKIKEDVAIRILHPNTAAAMGDKRIGTGKRGGKEFTILLDNLSSFRSG